MRHDDACRLAVAQSGCDGLGRVAAGQVGWLRRHLGVNCLGHGDVALFGAVAFASCGVVAAAGLGWVESVGCDLGTRVCCRDEGLCGRVC